MFRPIIVLGLCLAISGSLPAQPIPVAKKLIEYGWDIPKCDYIRKNIGAMEKLPFDGIIFGLTGWPAKGSVFTGRKWNEEEFRQIFDDCRNIRWQKFTDNFVSVLANSDMDWCSDQDWEAVRFNLGLVVKAAALARCRGICFDPETYGKNPWRYADQPHAAEKSFAEYEAIVRKRGAEFMQTVGRQMPRAVIHTFYLFSACGAVAAETDARKREERLARDGYGLYPAFINGMLDAAGPDIVITDGNEFSYYYTKPIHFYQAYHQIKRTFGPLIAPENVGKYDRQVKLSQALYVDYVFGLGDWMAKRPSPAPLLKPDERMRWFQNNVFYALRTSDEFAWLYSEEMNWWSGAGIPPGLGQTIKNARARLAAHEGPGADLPEIPPARKK